MVFLRKILLLSILIPVYNAVAQDTDYKLSMVTTGVSMSMFKKHKLTLYGGYSGTNNQQFFRVYPAFKVNKHLTLTPGYTFNDTYKNGTDSYEHHIMAIGTINIPIGKDKKWTLASRNMYHYKARRNKENISYYRNRLGINYKTQIAQKNINLFLNEEVYLHLEEGGIYRNQVSVGGNITLPWLTPQIMYIYQTGKNSDKEHLFNLSIVIPLENFGFFTRK